MGKEIERKFLVNKKLWRKTQKPQGLPIRQGFLLTEPEKTIRIRLTPEKAFLTIKGIGEGIVRTEFEYEIPRNDAEEILNQFPVRELSKVRFKVEFENKLWEIDEFSGENEGLILAEIELEDENEEFTKPEWVEEEVTENPAYYNANLVNHPFQNWKEN